MSPDRQPEPHRPFAANHTDVVRDGGPARPTCPPEAERHEPSGATAAPDGTDPVKPSRRPQLRHGTRSCYTAGCRRPECRAANTAYLRRRTRTRAPQGRPPYSVATAALERDGLTAEQWDQILVNTGLVHHVLNRLRVTRPDEQEDAYQDGLFGLMRAAQKFDPARGFRFSTYAIPWIRQAITRGRGAEMGVNYRRAFIHGDGDPWVDPVSLDADRDTGDDDLSIIDLIPGDDDTEADATIRILQEQAGAVLAAACRDDLDRAAAQRLLGLDLRPRPQIVAPFDVTVETLRKREQALLAILRASGVADALHGTDPQGRGTGDDLDGSPQQPSEAA